MFENDTTTEAAKIERSPEFEAFRELTRARALLAKSSMGWPTESLNQTLVKLGLEPIQEFEVVVEVTATNTYTRRIEADRRGVLIETQEQAIEQSRGRTDRAVLNDMPYEKWQLVERSEPRVIVPGIEGAEPDPIALGTDLDAYKKLVRRVGIAAGKERGWCDSGVNEYMDALGLPRKQAFRVPVEATVVQRFHLTVDDAESLEEAQQMVAAGDLPSTLEAVRAQLGTGVRAVVETKMPEPGDLAEGDPDPSDHGAVHCQARHMHPRNGRVYCTMLRGHAGDHVAGNGTRVIGIWPNADAPVPVPAGV